MAAQQQSFSGEISVKLESAVGSEILHGITINNGLLVSGVQTEDQDEKYTAIDNDVLQCRVLEAKYHNVLICRNIQSQLVSL